VGSFKLPGFQLL